MLAGTARIDMAGGTDQTFLNDCKNAKYPAEHFEPGGGAKAAEVFYLHHSMARVEYAVANWREKNMEALQDKAVRTFLAVEFRVDQRCS